MKSEFHSCMIVCVCVSGGGDDDDIETATFSTDISEKIHLLYPLGSLFYNMHDLLNVTLK